ncbi:hypothetical protein [Desulfofarcimen acetoxidans]|nr:hypothetical protein [Desulfofarcimen acetoxidans]
MSVRDLVKLDSKPVFRTRIEFYNGMQYSIREPLQDFVILRNQHDEVK